MALAQTAMSPDQVEVRLIEMHLPFKPLDLLGEGHRLAGEAPVFMAQIQVLPFDRNRLNRMQGNIAEHGSFGNPDQPLSFIPLLDHLAVGQGRTSHQFWPSRPPSLAGAGIGFNHMVAGEKSAAVCVQAVTDPKRCSPPWHSRSSVWAIKGSAREDSVRPIQKEIIILDSVAKAMPIQISPSKASLGGEDRFF